MRLLSVLLSIVFLCDFTIFPMPATAAAVNFKPAGDAATIDGQVPVGKLGSLALKDAQAILRGNTVDVEASVDGAKKTVLSGVVFQSRSSGSGKNQKVTGYVYFRQGTSMTEIDDPATEEMIDIEDGGIVGGHIVAVNRDRVEIETPAGTREVGIEKIRRICSPRIYSFVMAVAAGAPVTAGAAYEGDARQIELKPTAQRCKKNEAQASNQRLCCPGFAIAGKVDTKQQSAKAESGPIGKIVLITAVMAAIATAIAVPVAVGVANRNHGPNPNDVATQLQYVRMHTPPPPPPPPPPSSSPSTPP